MQKENSVFFYLAALCSVVESSLQRTRRVGRLGFVLCHALGDGYLRLVGAEHDAVAHGLSVGLHWLVLHTAVGPQTHNSTEDANVLRNNF